ncbi:MAG: UDP-N-acetylmuramyl-tripeptide synthetase [Patescibacteria group bacterium]|jgi:UDP-N-acetylmuramoyl-L-alanyl-D-glutamate--2,6-diaminopimelate ligase
MNKLLHIIKKLIPTKLFKAVQPAYHFLFAFLAAAIYRWPSEKLIVIGVTGTTGKTTSTYLISKMLSSCGFKVGYTSTAMFSDGNKEWLNDKKMTMPGRLFTQGTLAQMVRNGCQYAIVETSSEGIRQFRHRFINYDILIITGLYPEHIESHGGFENYKAAKGKLFAHLKNCKIKYTDETKRVIKTERVLKKLELARIKKTIIANLDDEHAGYFLDFWAEEKFAYTRENKIPAKEINPVNYDEVLVDESGTKFKTQDFEISLKLTGDFNATNAMNAVCLGLAQGLPLPKIKIALEEITGVPGRLEKIECGQNFTVIVDYAFEPKAIEKLYETAASIPHQRIIHLLGSAGGGRDMSRRPILGRIAGERADEVIVTNEDPYDENPEIIIDQVLLGAEKAGKIMNENLWRLVDRREAIKKALRLAEIGDLVLITGKGSEQAISLANGEKMSWDDRQVVKEELVELISEDVDK